MDKTVKHIIISLSIGIILGMLFCVGLKFCHNVDNGVSPKTVVERDTTIIVKNDTIVVNNPIELEKTIIKYDTITDKQFGMIEVFEGKQESGRPVEGQQLELF